MRNIGMHNKGAEHGTLLIALNGYNLLQDANVGAVRLPDTVVVTRLVLRNFSRGELSAKFGYRSLEVHKVRQIVRMDDTQVLLNRHLLALVSKNALYRFAHVLKGQFRRIENHVIVVARLNNVDKPLVNLCLYLQRRRSPVMGDFRPYFLYFSN